MKLSFFSILALTCLTRLAYADIVCGKLSQAKCNVAPCHAPYLITNIVGSSFVIRPETETANNELKVLVNILGRPEVIVEACAKGTIEDGTILTQEIQRSRSGR